MLTTERVCVVVSGLHREELEHWIALDWVRPQRQADEWQFQEIDVARVRLVQQLHRDLGIARDTMPVVLSLLDQLYDTRRQLGALRRAIEATVPPPLGESVLRAYRDQTNSVPR